MSKNAEEFLDIFNHIERYLKTKYNNGDYIPFRDLLRNISYKEGLIRRYKRDLYTYSDLRNVLVHNARINGQIIAEPIDKVLDNIKNIWDQIQHPEKVTKFKKKVLYCFSDDKLSKALQFMREQKISQIPIIEKGEIIDVLNASHIADWLAIKEIVSPTEETISDILQNAERNNNFEIIKGNMPIYDAAEIFKSSYKKPPVNWYYDALLITPNGKSNEQLTGIIVLKDIAEYISN